MADVAQQFVAFYYKTFDENRANLASLYRDESMLTFESSSHKGGNDILEKLTSLPFSRVAHEPTTLDAQPSVSGGILVLVTGRLLVDEEQRPMNYTQVFHLMPNGAGSYFVYNDIFKLVYSA